MGLTVGEVSMASQMLYAGMTLKMGHSYSRKRKLGDHDNELCFGHVNLELFVLVC